LRDNFEVSAKSKAIPGQRWVSDSEPELGLGIILQAQFGRVEILFPAAGETRQYAAESAPIRRVQFAAGDKIKTHQGETFVVDTVTEKDGLLIYQAGARALPEAELSDTISFSKPEDRLLGGQVDDMATYELRVEALHRRSAIRRSPVRGFVGARMDLIPHQMSIAQEVASRLAPRVLLADEVGLGKTIEACLILHRLNLTGRADRVLILVPDALIHQWFVELWRRFNLLFSIFDKERCESLEEHDTGANPFLDSQLVLCSVNFLESNPGRAAQVIEAGWDLLIVDEAHHLEWTPKVASPQYTLVETLSKATSAVLLLTATPQQLGAEGHFARLRLLDPDRYTDLEHFLEESSHYEHVAKAIDRLIDGKKLSKTDQKLFGDKAPGIRAHCEALNAGEESARQKLVSEILDAFGVGRVMFRNTRAALTGFPKRKAVLAPLKPTADVESVQLKIVWLVRLLKKLGNDKVLLICRTRALAEEIYERLQKEVRVKAGLFHEDLTLMQRDRNAAFFAEEDGARVLICSEIGSEGRNFQFAHHLVLFDIPENPELLEQRIGRLDRIGQTALIQIHVPYIEGDASEVLARWYHEGLNAFEKNPHGAMEIARVMADERLTISDSFEAKTLETFLVYTQELHSKTAAKLKGGHDRLLELNSSKPEQAAEMVNMVREAGADTTFEQFVVRAFDHFGVQVEDHSARSYVLRPGHLLTDAFPALPEEGTSVTFEREKALSREDLGFLTSDHPLVRSTLDLLLGSESGNSAFGVWKNSARESLFLEIYAIAECVAPAKLHVDRFLPATPIRILIDHQFADKSDDETLQSFTLEKADVFRLLDRGAVKKKLLPAMLEKAQGFAAARMQAEVAAATVTMETSLQNEIDRLENLKAVNDHVRNEEIDALKTQKGELKAAIEAAHLRLDAVRLILCSV